MQRTYEFLNKVHKFFVATKDGDGISMRPFGALNMFDNKIYFQTGRVKDVYKQLAADPHVAINCFDEETKHWIRIQATAVEDNRIEAIQSLLDANPSIQSLYTADDGNCVVFYLKDVTVRFCQFGAPDEVVTF